MDQPISLPMYRAIPKGAPTTRKQWHERIFPFQGPWHLPWVIERYFRAAMSGFTPRKVMNATLALSEMKMGRLKVKSKPFILRLEPTNVCNLQCPLCMCGTGEDPRKKGMMSLEDFAHIHEQARDSAMITRLDGLGEPTLHPKIFELIKIAKSYRTSVVMHSNFSTKNCEHPEPFLDCGIDRLVISVDGASQETHGRYRVGGDLEVVLNRMRALVAERKRRGVKRPIIEMQTVDFDFNRDEQAILRQMAKEIGADRYQVTEVQRSLESNDFDPEHPRRCAWLWCVMTVAWNLDYRSCTNAWSVPWPRYNLRSTPPKEFWNTEIMQEARKFNIDKSSALIANDPGCRCNRCHEMMVIPLTKDYTCD